MSLLLSFFYAIQVITVIKSFDESHKLAQQNMSEYLAAENSSVNGGDDVENSFLEIYSLLLLTTILQFASAWFDYQFYERWLLHGNSVLFGLIVGLLVLSGMKHAQDILHGNSLWQLFYVLNCMLGAWISLVDLLDVRPLGAGRKLDLLQQSRGDSSVRDDDNDEQRRTALHEAAPTKHFSRRNGTDKYLTIDNNDEDETGSGGTVISEDNKNKVGDADFFTDLESGKLAETATSHVFISSKMKGLNKNVQHVEDPCTALSSISLLASDVVDEFRVKLDRLSSIAASGSTPEAWSNHSDRTWSESSSSNAPSSLPTDISWDSFSFIEHRIDSSSCHIYTALWQKRPVIVKLIKADRVNSAVSLSEFDAEAAVLECVRHPHIVRMLGSGRAPRRFLVLELLDGGSMSHALGLRPDSLDRTRRQKFSYLETLTLAKNLASALDHLHRGLCGALQVIHRDVKPDNIGWTSDGTLKLFDFGLCSLVLSEAGMQAHTTNGGTSLSYTKGYRMTGNTGTLRYMAPEVALNQPYHASVDVYSFSIVIWQVLAGRVPFQEMGKRRYMEKVVKGGLRPELSAVWPAAFRRLLVRCWDKDKNKRPMFSEIVQTLDTLLKTEQALELSGWRRVRNIVKSVFASLKIHAVRVRPLFLVVFAFFMLGSVAAVSQEHIHTGIGLAIFTAIGMYLTLVSGLRYHLRGEGQLLKRSSNQSKNADSRDSSTNSDSSNTPDDVDADDIISMSVGLESGSKKNNRDTNGSAFKFTFNPLEPEDEAPLYGL